MISEYLASNAEVKIWDKHLLVFRSYSNEMERKKQKVAEKCYKTFWKIYVYYSFLDSSNSQFSLPNCEVHPLLLWPLCLLRVWHWSPQGVPANFREQERHWDFKYVLNVGSKNCIKDAPCPWLFSWLCLTQSPWEGDTISHEVHLFSVCHTYY